jgi:hypothetical protein
MKTFYMHILSGCAASYTEGQQVCFSVKTRPIRLCSSLKELRRQWKESEAWRARRGYAPTSYVHSYRRVRLPSAKKGVQA